MSDQEKYTKVTIIIEDENGVTTTITPIASDVVLSYENPHKHTEDRGLYRVFPPTTVLDYNLSFRGHLNESQFISTQHTNLKDPVDTEGLTSESAG